MSQNPIESKIETYLKKQIKAVGGLCYKFKSTVNGVPDQLIVYNSNMYLVEVKRPGEVPRANQVHVHGQIEKQGVPVYTVDTMDGVDTFILDVLKAEPVKTRTQATDKPVIQSKRMFKGL